MSQSPNTSTISEKMAAEHRRTNLSPKHGVWISGLVNQIVILTEVWNYDQFGVPRKCEMHKYFGIPSRVIRAETYIELVALAGQGKGRVRYLDRPKKVEVVRDEFGFTINDRSQHNVKLIYKYVTNWEPQVM